VLAGCPQAEDWDNVQQQMSDLLQDAPRHLEAVRQEQRGDFISLSTGVSYGGGQTVCVPNKQTQRMLTYIGTWKSSAWCVGTIRD
jgi:hypothetical protein